jgi:hypothetical protein
MPIKRVVHGIFCFLFATAGCGEPGPSDQSDMLLGVWKLDLGPGQSCFNLLEFSESGEYSEEFSCPVDDTTRHVESTSGTYEVQSDVIAMRARRSSCNDRTTDIRRVEFILISPTRLLLLGSGGGGYLDLLDDDAGISEADREPLYGCFRGNVFTPAPVQNL